MELSHRFTVPTGVEETWEHFEDIVTLAECFPGAQVTSAEGDSFTGTVKVKLGPIALVYNGSGTFVEKDHAEKRFVVEAKGRDKRGNGTAGAHVTVTMADAAGSTAVSVATDLAITGKPAQFGRGVMQDVSDKLLGQFVACLEQQLTGDDGAGDGGAATDPSDVGGSPVASPTGSTAPQAPGAPAPPLSAPAAKRPEAEALDLGSAALPVLARLYWKQALGLVVIIAVLRRLLTR